MEAREILGRLGAAEKLAVEPTAHHLAQIVPLLASVVAEVEKGIEEGTAALLSERVRGLREMLDGALQIRLGLARASTCGLAGYNPNGHSAEGSTGGKGGFGKLA